MRRLIYASLALVCIGIDQLVKYWARTYLILEPGGSLPVIQDIFHLTYAENRGAAFSILLNQRWFFIALSSAVTLVLLYILLVRRPILGWMPGIPISLFLAGAVGNLIDRIMHGYVVDLFEARFIRFAIFNVADSCMVCAAVALSIWIILDSRKKENHVETSGE